jgi:hypothetical protein
VVVLADARPVLERFPRDRLRAVDDAVAVVRVLGGAIVVAADVQRGEEIVELLPRPLVVATVDPGRDGSRRIDAPHVLGEHPRDPRAFRTATLHRLVADAPHDHGRVVAVAPQHDVEVAAPPVVEAHVVVANVLAVAPTVERFVDDEHPEAVACVEERRRRRIVRTAHSVESVRLEQLDLAFLGTIVRRRAERTVVVVHAAASQLERLAVQAEAGTRRERDRANAERRRGRVDELPVDTQFRLERVEVRCVG